MDVTPPGFHLKLELENSAVVWINSFVHELYKRNNARRQTFFQ